MISPAVATSDTNTLTPLLNLTLLAPACLDRDTAQVTPDHSVRLDKVGKIYRSKSSDREIARLLKKKPYKTSRIARRGSGFLLLHSATRSLTCYAACLTFWVTAK